MWVEVEGLGEGKGEGAGEVEEDRRKEILLTVDVNDNHKRSK